MSTINDSDLLLVERNGNLHQITYDQMSTLNDDDILLVERGGVKYKLAAADLDLKSGTLGSPVEVLTPLNGAGVGGPRSFTPQTDDISDIKTILNYGYASENLGLAYNAVADMAYGNGTYVVLPQWNESVKYSTDEGLNWNSAAWVGGGRWYALTWNGSVFCAVGNSSSQKIATSPDGINWTPVNSPPNCTFYDVTSDPVGGRIVAVGNDNTNSGKGIWYSTDNGASWSSASISAGWLPQSDKDYYRVAYGNGKWVAVPNRRDVSPAYSTNGSSWTQGTTRYVADQSMYEDIVYDPDQNRFAIFWMYNNGLKILTSYNGSSWTENTSYPGAGDIYEGSICYGNGLYLFVGTESGYRDGYFYTTASQGMTNWSYQQRTYYNGNENIYKAFFLNGRFWIWEGSMLRRMQAQNSFGGTIPYDNINDRYTKFKHDKITLSGTNIYDSSDGSLKSDHTLADIFPATIDSGSSSAGGPAVAFHNLDGTTLTINNGGGFTVGGRINGNGQLTEYGPSPSEVEFTSQNAGTTPVSATEATLSFRRWTLETRSSTDDPWTVVTTADDYDPVTSQDGATPWSSNKPTLTPDTMYRVKVEYNSANADPIGSVYNTFTTGPNS